MENFPLKHKRTLSKTMFSNSLFDILVLQSLLRSQPLHRIENQQLIHQIQGVTRNISTNYALQTGASSIARVLDHRRSHSWRTHRFYVWKQSRVKKPTVSLRCCSSHLRAKEQEWWPWFSPLGWRWRYPGRSVFPLAFLPGCSPGSTCRCLWCSACLLWVFRGRGTTGSPRNLSKSGLCRSGCPLTSGSRSGLGRNRRFCT